VTNAILCDSRLSAFPVRPLSSLSPSLVTLALLLFRSLSRVLPLSVLFYTLPSSSCTLLSRFRYKRPVFIVACLLSLLSLALLTSALTSRELSARNAILDHKHRNPPAIPAIESLLVELRGTQNTSQHLDLLTGDVTIQLFEQILRRGN